VRLRSVQSTDGEQLRVWKNSNRRFFFCKDEITEEAQARWIAGYLGRPDDYLFLVECEARAVGCMGFRSLDGEVDVYNVILGDTTLRGSGVMSLALRMMLGFARRVSERVSLKVLKDNPAIRFYEHNGFLRKSDHGDHLKMTLDWSRFQEI
jgi:RimJ/RimL family protein N-acetyltransferase